MNFIEQTGYDYWNPIIWLIAFVVAMVIVYFFRSRGQKTYKQSTDQAKIFLCGEEVPEPGQRHIRVKNIYWGFFETLSEYYDKMTKAHTGIVNDYVIWFVAITAITIVTLVVAR